MNTRKNRLIIFIISIMLMVTAILLPDKYFFRTYLAGIIICVIGLAMRLFDSAHFED